MNSITSTVPGGAPLPAGKASLFDSNLACLSLQADGLGALRACMERDQPVVIDDFAASWPALRRWDPESLSRRFGDREVRVYDASFGEPGRNYMRSIDSMPFSRFLDEVLEQGRDLRMFLYNISRQVPELLDDIDFPAIGPKFSRRFVFTFFGCRGSTTPLHFDIDMGQVFHTVIRGRRRVRLFAPEQSRALYRHPFTVRSYVDLDAPDLARWPALAGARGIEVVLEPGQTLYMPPGWWHEFHYLDSGIGISLRTPARRFGPRLLGALNLLAISPVDRIANRLFGPRWFAWKQRRAVQRARQLHLSKKLQTGDRN
ncbi:MAG: cupin-like domain-containing protein [Gammaproteobacteria bacterium HGW-Gammaproteobacteria-8]|nr:MAG: cupin-like domain-containing protein [Gammaproteobacteria bacterium HGW-Gammaproteobacteria-8]